MSMKNGEYTLVNAPSEYPGKKYRDRYCYEHHLVWWENTGEVVKKGEIIHHINHNKTDNRFQNLRIMCRKKHTIYHNVGYEVVMLKCPICLKSFELAKSVYRRRVKVHGDYKICCGRRCQTKKQWQSRV